MPAPQGKMRGPKALRPYYDSTEVNGKRRKKAGNKQVQVPTFRKAFRGTTLPDNSSEDDRKKLDDKLLEEVSDCLYECSRQRLRAVHMSMRQYGNEASRISTKDVITSLQENKVVIYDRILKVLTEKFEDQRGFIDLEAYYKFLVEAHSKTGRDSVLAMRKRNDLAPKCDVTQEEVDEDLIWRIEALLIKTQSYIHVTELRAAFQARDSKKTGRLEGSVVRQICQDQQMPVYGALLRNLLKRCDNAKNDKIRWSEFISFLETGQKNAWLTCPDLKDIPEKLKNQTPVAPSLIDEISSKTRNTLVNKFRMKASIKKKESIDAEDEDRHAIGDASKVREENNNLKSNPLHAKNDKSSLQEKPLIEIKLNGMLPQEKSKVADDSSITKGTQVLIDNLNIEQDDTIVNTTPNELKPGTESDYTREINEHDQIQPLKGDSQSDSRVIDTVLDDQPKSDALESTDQGDNVNDIGSSVTIKVQDKDVTFHVPQEYLSNNTLDPPTESLRMRWVYGYRGNDCRKNIHVLANGDIVYFMSYIAIIYNINLHIQKHYTEHTDEIKSYEQLRSHFTNTTLAVQELTCSLPRTFTPFITASVRQGVKTVLAHPKPGPKQCLVNNSPGFHWTSQV